MAVYPKGKKFTASFGAGTTRVRKTFNTVEAALVWEQALKGASNDLPAPSPTCWTLQEAFDQTLKHHWTTGGGVGKAIINAKYALAFFGPTAPISEISAKWIVE